MNSYSVLTVVFDLVINSLLELLLQVSACKKGLLNAFPCLLLVGRVFKFSSGRQLSAFENFKCTARELGLTHL